MSELEPNENDGDRDSNPMAALLQQALAEPPAPKRSLLPNIQQRIRVHTRGRFYRDRWSVARDPISLLLMVALLILILGAALFMVLQPLIDVPQKTELPTPALDPMVDDGGEKQLEKAGSSSR